MKKPEWLADGIGNVTQAGLDQLVRRNLRGVWLVGDLPRGACVWASNHHSWWDFFVANAALRSTGRRDVGVLMKEENLGNTMLFEQNRVVGTRQIRTALGLLQSGNVLVVFPEGDLRPLGPVSKVERGARWLADRGGSELRAVATRVVLRGNQSPEAYLRVSKPLSAGTDLGVELSGLVAELDGDLSSADPARPLPGYRQVVSGVRSWNERFEALRGRT